MTRLRLAGLGLAAATALGLACALPVCAETVAKDAVPASPAPVQPTPSLPAPSQPAPDKPAPQAKAPAWQETPFLAARVANGDLPPIAERLPKSPRVIDLKALGREPGEPGGTIRTLIGDQRELSEMTVYGYARLVVFDHDYKLVPDILDHYEVKDGRVFTLHLRPGHKWSDGAPFTAEDFRYFWEDMANDKHLSPSGPPAGLMVNGKPPKFEVLDPLTVRYSWDDPNPGFLPALAGAQPLYIEMPAHYLKQFHPRYADPDALAKLIAKAHVKDWSALHERASRRYRPENPKLPVLDPWCNTTKPPSQEFVFERNPFYHRVDAEGHQLPYVDRVRLLISTHALIPARASGGEVDLQARYVSFDTFTFLKQAEKRGTIKVHLWSRGEGGYFTLVPNQNAADPVWRALNRDVRYRRALSLAVNRLDINRVFFFGLANDSANTILKESPLYKPDYATAWTAYDPGQANRLLDAVGLRKRDSDGIRLLPDGRRAELTIDTAGTTADETDILQLIDDDFRKIGVRIFPHTSSADMFQRRIYAGQTVMALASGFDNAVPTADTEPSEMAPSSESQYRWPLWGTYVETGGREGEAPATQAAQTLVALLKQWRMSASADERRAIWGKMLMLNAEEVTTIGIINRVPQPIVSSPRLRNLPDKALYSFEPGAFLGIYMPDTFWFAGKQGRVASLAGDTR